MNMRHIKSATSVSKLRCAHGTTSHPSKTGGKQKQAGKSGGKCQQYMLEEIRCSREYINKLYRQNGMGKGRLNGVAVQAPGHLLQIISCNNIE